MYRPGDWVIFIGSGNLFEDWQLQGPYCVKRFETYKVVEALMRHKNIVGIDVPIATANGVCGPVYCVCDQLRPACSLARALYGAADDEV